MHIVRKPINSKNYITTIALGQNYLKSFKKYSLPTWLKYCEKHDLGIIIFTCSLVKLDSKNWKKANWQKLLIGNFIKQKKLEIDNICFLDTDILINHFSPNIFNFYDNDTFGLVSQFKNIPFPMLEAQKRIAYNRHHFYNKNYPLDSALFMSPEQIFKSMNLSVFQNYACTGLILFNVEKHSEIMYSWFNKYPSNIETLTGGEEPHLNWEIQNYGKITWLDYKYQAIWIFEQAWNYPFLYTDFQKNKKIIRLCIESCLSNNHFLHFAGSWFESEMWKNNKIYKSDVFLNRLNKFQKYLSIKPKAIAVGQVKPN